MAEAWTKQIAKAQGGGTLQRAVSAAQTALTLTIAAPGAGKALHLTAVAVYYSDGQDQEITIGATQGGGGTSFTFRTGTADGLMVLFGIDVLGDANTAITVDAPVGGPGDVSTISVIYWTEDL